MIFGRHQPISLLTSIEYRFCCGFLWISRWKNTWGYREDSVLQQTSVCNFVVIRSERTLDILGRPITQILVTGLLVPRKYPKSLATPTSWKELTLKTPLLKSASRIRGRSATVITIALKANALWRNFRSVRGTEGLIYTNHSRARKFSRRWSSLDFFYVFCWLWDSWIGRILRILWLQEALLGLSDRVALFQVRNFMNQRWTFVGDGDIDVVFPVWLQDKDFDKLCSDAHDKKGPILRSLTPDNEESLTLCGRTRKGISLGLAKF